MLKDYETALKYCKLSKSYDLTDPLPPPFFVKRFKSIECLLPFGPGFFVILFDI